VKNNGGKKTESSQQECEQSCLPADDHSQGCRNFKNDYQGQQGARNAHGIHITLGGRITGDLGKTGKQKNGRDQQAACAVEVGDECVH